MNPADTVMDLKQFLSDAPETCFYTAYDLILAKPDGLRYHLLDFVEIGEVAPELPKGGCVLEMFGTFYDERAVRVHVRKTRELLSMMGSQSSVSTTMAAEYEAVRGLATERDLGGDEKDKEEGEGEDKAGEEKKADEDKAEEGGEEAKGKGKGKGKDKEKERKEKEEKEKKEKEKREKKLKEKKAREEEIAALDKGLGFGEDVKGVLEAVVGKEADEEEAPQCVEYIAFSSFNPVPGRRR